MQDGFYDCADELGILLEQDGIFSNGYYSAAPSFLDLIAEEIEYQARRLASHPSLFMWSGSNELSPHGYARARARPLCLSLARTAET